MEIKNNQDFWLRKIYVSLGCSIFFLLCQYWCCVNVFHAIWIKIAGEWMLRAQNLVRLRPSVDKSYDCPCWIKICTIT